MIKPMLAHLEPKAFNSPSYIWETKHDGIRAIVKVDGSKYSIQSRSGKDKTAMFPELKFNAPRPIILDGELVSRGIFQNIQHRLGRVSNISAAVDNYPATYKAFDILDLDNVDLAYSLLLDRKELLQTNLSITENVEIGEYTEDGIALFGEIKKLADISLAKNGTLGGHEGVVGKCLDGVYEQGVRRWIKVKMWQYGTFVVVGYTEGTGWRKSTFGALVLGDFYGKYVGSVGTGFDVPELERLKSMFVPAFCPFAPIPEPATWVRPFEIKIQYLELTNDGRVRFPSYKGLA